MVSMDDLVVLVAREPALVAAVRAGLAGDGLVTRDTPTADGALDLLKEERLTGGGAAAVLLDAVAVGAGLVEAIKALGRLVPEPAVIVLGADGAPASALAETLIDAGAQDVLPLPVEDEALRHAVRLAIRRQGRETAQRAARRAAEGQARDSAQLLDSVTEAVRGSLGGTLAAARLTLDDPLLPRQRDRLEALHEAVQGLSSALDDLRDLARSERGGTAPEMAAFDLEPLVDSVLSQVATPRRRKTGGLTVVIEPDAPRRLIGDSGRLRSLLLTLAGPASLAVGGQGARLTVSAERRDGAVADVRFALSAAGLGSAAGAGGLTLAIARRLVERLGGRIGVDGAPGQGGGVWFVPGCRPVAPPPTPPASLSVLLVEDNPIGRLVANGFLKSLGHRVTLAEDGAVGLALATEQRFDLIIMDVQMPVMDGHAATRAIRRLDGAAGQVPIVALSAGNEPEDDAQCLAAGMTACLHKPLSMDALRAVIARLLPGG